MFGAYLDESVPVAEAAQDIEALGFDYAVTGEHVGFHSPTTNALITLAMAAGATTRLRLLSTIVLLPLYPAALLAKMVAELVRRSGERFDLGVGVGGEYPAEFEACGVDVSERVARTDETLEVMRLLLSGEQTDFQGRFATLKGFALSPPAPSMPPIWMGGRKEGAMRRAARYADIWMPYLYTPEQLHDSLHTIRGYAAELERPSGAISGSIYAWTCVAEDRPRAIAKATKLLSAVYGMDMGRAAERYVLAGDPQDCAARLLEYSDAGAERFIFAPLADDGRGRMAMLEKLAGEVIPRFQKLHGR